MERKIRKLIKNLRENMSNCEGLEDAPSQLVLNSARISLASEEEFETLLDIAIVEKLANMKDLNTKFSELQEGGNKSIPRLELCSQLAADVKKLQAVGA